MYTMEHSNHRQRVIYFIRCHFILICIRSKKTKEYTEGMPQEEKRMQRVKSKRKNKVSAYKL